MMTKHKTVSGALLALVAGSLVASRPPANGQNANRRVIEMTSVLANIEKTVDAKRAKVGDILAAKTITAGELNDGTVVPVGSELEGRVDAVTPSKHKSDSTMVLTIDTVRLKGGKGIHVKAVIVSIETLLPRYNGGRAPDEQYFDRPPRTAPNLQPNSNYEIRSNTGRPPRPHPVPGMTLTGSVRDSSSGTLTQAGRNVHLSNETQIQVALAILPPNVRIKR
jgi:hypothetical protein